MATPDNIEYDFDAQPEAEVLPMTPMGGRAGQMAESGVSYEMVQQIMDTERRRSRRALWAITFTFLLLMLLIVAVVLSVGIIAFNENNALASGIQKDQTRLSLEGRKLASDMEDMEDREGKMTTALTVAETDRVEKRQLLQSDLEAFSSYNDANNRQLVKSLDRYNERLVELEEDQVRKDEELRVLRAVLEGEKGAAVPLVRVEGDNPDDAVTPDGADVDVALAPDAADSADVDPVTDDGVGTGISSGVADQGEPDPVVAVPDTAVVELAAAVPQPRPVGFDNAPELTEGEYVGEKENGQRHGQGSYMYRNGDRYVGTFIDDKRAGDGTLYTSDGGVYEGSFRKDQMTGEGVYAYPNGEVYRGNFLNSMRDGHGVYTYEDGGKYVGTFRKGERHGKGSYRYPSGAEYDGYFKDGRMHGQGVYIFTDGTRIEGIWEEGEIKE